MRLSARASILIAVGTFRLVLRKHSRALGEAGLCQASTASFGTGQLPCYLKVFQLSSNIFQIRSVYIPGRISHRNLYRRGLRADLEFADLQGLITDDSGFELARRFHRCLLGRAG